MRRRDVLRLGAATLLAAAAGGPYQATFRRGIVPRLACATPGTTLVVVFLRGGLDGLHAVLPHADPEYYRVRPRLSPPRGAGLDLDGRFAFHPALAPLLPLYREGCLAVVHGIGTPEASRSHFEAQDYLEAGGWLNRYLGLRTGSSPLRGVSTTQRLPALLQGPVPVASVPGFPAPAGIRREDDPFAFEVEQALGRLDPAAYRTGAAWPSGPLADQLRLAAFLLKSGVPLEAVHAELGGFDTHAFQVDPAWPGSAQGLNGLLDHLAMSLAAFWEDLGAHRDRVILVTLTEFGRRVAENASAGTDHGRASCCFVLGGRVRGGRVAGTVPSLEEGSLYEGLDLPVTTDYRDLLLELTGAGPALFPGHRAGPGPGVN